MLVSTLANALANLGPQMLALVVLSPLDFGRFSLVYLIFALGASIMLSTVCEAATLLSRADDATRRDYLGAAAWLAAPVVPLALICSLAVGADFSPSLALALASALSSYRVAARFLEVARGHLAQATRSDATGAVALILAAVLAHGADLRALDTVALAWLCAATASVVAGARPPVTSPRTLASWVRTRRDRIVYLLKDSLILDASSIGAPYLVAPLLGVAGFGVYRAISNVAAPARLLLNPLRPAIAVAPRTTVLGRRALAVTAGCSVLLGVLAAGLLLAVGASGVKIGVLTDVADHAWAAGVFVTASLAGHYLYLVARSHADGRTLWRGRLAQSGFALMLPIVGAITGDTATAIWFYVAATVLGAAIWAGLLRRPSASSDQADATSPH